MYGDRKLAKTNRLKFKENDYFVEAFEQYIRETGQQSESVLRQWFRERMAEVTAKKHEQGDEQKQNTRFRLV